MNNHIAIILGKLLTQTFTHNRSMYDSRPAGHFFKLKTSKHLATDIVHYQTIYYVEHNGLVMDLDIYIGTWNLKRFLPSVKIVPTIRVASNWQVSLPKNNGGFTPIYTCETGILKSIKKAHVKLNQTLQSNPYFKI